MFTMEFYYKIDCFSMFCNEAEETIIGSKHKDNDDLAMWIIQGKNETKFHRARISCLFVMFFCMFSFLKAMYVKMKSTKHSQTKIQIKNTTSLLVLMVLIILVHQEHVFLIRFINYSIHLGGR